MTITEGIAIGGVLLTAGAALARLASLGERVTKLERGGEDQGRRIGSLEAEQKAIAAAREVERDYSRPIHPKG